MCALPGPAVEADAARDVALRGHVVALRDVADRAPDRDDRPAELVPERERRLHALRRPLVPALDVQIGAADRRRLDPDEDLVRPGCRYGHLVERRARARTRACGWRASSPRRDDLATSGCGGDGLSADPRVRRVRRAAVARRGRHEPTCPLRRGCSRSSPNDVSRELTAKPSRGPSDRARPLNASRRLPRTVERER